MKECLLCCREPVERSSSASGSMGMGRGLGDRGGCVDIPLYCCLSMSMACFVHLVSVSVSGSGDIRGRASSDQLYWLLGLSCKGRTGGLAGCVEASIV